MKAFSKRRMLYSALLLLILVLGLLAISTIQNVRRYKMGPVDALFVPLFDGTRWASGYSEAAFKSIDVGMTKAQVRSILGECLGEREAPSGGDLWHYTIGKDGRFMSASVHSTHLRIVRFGTNGLVVGKTYDFYFD